MPSGGGYAQRQPQQQQQQQQRQQQQHGATSKGAPPPPAGPLHPVARLEQQVDASMAALQVRGPTKWTITRCDGPNQLGLW